MEVEVGGVRHNLGKHVGLVNHIHHKALVELDHRSLYKALVERDHHILDNSVEVGDHRIRGMDAVVCHHSRDKVEHVYHRNHMDRVGDRAVDSRVEVLVHLVVVAVVVVEPPFHSRKTHAMTYQNIVPYFRAFLVYQNVFCHLMIRCLSHLCVCLLLGEKQSIIASQHKTQITSC